MKISKNIVTCLLFFIVTLLMSGFRWDVGVDWMSYYLMYSEFKNETLAESQEPINLLIHDILIKFGFTDSRYWIWVMAVISLYYIYRSLLTYSSSVIKSIILFFIMGFFFDSLNAVRQFCAISISMMSWKYALENKFIKFTLIITTASLFHFSAICVGTIFFLSRYYFNKKIIGRLLVVALILAPISTIIAPKLITIIPAYEKYADSNVIKFATGSGNYLSYLRMVFPTIMVFIIKANLSTIYNTQYWRLITNISLIGLYLLIAFPTTLLIIRLSYYFYIALIFLIPYICSKTRTSGSLIWLITIIYYITFTTITYLLRPEAKILPYNLKFDLMGWELLLLTICVILISSTLISKSNKIWKVN